MGTKFTVYDNGANPCKNPASLLDESSARQELAAICYVSEPQTVCVCAPQVGPPPPS